MDTDVKDQAAYELPEAVEVGNFVAATNGNKRNNNADDTEYRQ